MKVTETVPGFPALTVTETEEGLIRASLELSNHPCDRCRQRTYRSNQHTLRVHDLPRNWKPVVLEVSYWSVRCRRGCTRPSPPVAAGLRAPTGKVTQRLHDALVDQYLRGATVPSLAAWSGVSVRALWPVLRQELDFRITRGHGEVDPSITHVGLDELFWRRRPLGVVIDLASGRLLEVLPDRGPATVAECLGELKRQIEGQTHLPWNPVIVTDMWSPFREAARSVFGPEVRVVADRFHLVAKVAEDLQEIGRALLTPDRQRAGQLLQLRMEYLRALKTGQVLCTVGTGDVRARLAEAIRVGVAFHRIWKQQTLADAEQTFFAWIGRQCDLERVNGHQPFSRTAFLLAQWKEEVLAFHRPDVLLPNGVRPTNGRTEGVNSRLRAFERRSQASQRLKWGGDDDEKAQVQTQFDRFAVRAMYTVNVPRPKPVPQTTVLTPQPEACRCGAPAEEVQWQSACLCDAWDFPLGGAPVRASLWTLTGDCPACANKWSLSVPTTGPMTTRLAEALQAQRQQGRLLGRLSAEAGPAVSTVQRHLKLTVSESPEAGVWIGILRWHWRRKPRWLITDIDSGRPLELLADFGQESLQRYLASPAARAVQVAFISSPEWRDWLPPNIKGVLDPFCGVQLVQPALQEVQWRFTDRLPVETLRTTRFKGHRRVLLENPQVRRSVERRRDEPDPAARRADFFREAPRLQEAHALMQAFRSSLWTAPASSQGLRHWQKQVDASVSHVPQARTVPLDRSFYFGFRAARTNTDEYSAELTRGARYRPARSLARSRRTLRNLKMLEAASGSDIETLRRAVLQVIPKVQPAPRQTTTPAIFTPESPAESRQITASPSTFPLTAEQRRVVESPHLVPQTTVVAVAGSGKTRVLTERAAYLVGQGVKAPSILFLTFTVAATEELGRRLKPKDSAGALTGNGRITGRCVTMTLHGFCRALVKAALPDYRPSTSPAVQRQVLQELNPKELGFQTFQQLQMAVSRAKQELTIAGIYADFPALDLQPFTEPPDPVRAALRAWEAVRSQLSNSSGLLQLDHDDTLLWALKALSAPTKAVAEMLAKYWVVIVDEYQDVSPLHVQLLDRIAAGKHFMAVGDPSQSVYGFQGGSPHLMQELKNRDGGLHFELSDNFRSPGQHLMAASAVLDDVALLVPATGFRGELNIQTYGEVDERWKLLSSQLRAWQDQPVTILVRTNANVRWVKEWLDHHLLGGQQHRQQADADTLRRWNDPACQRLLLPLLHTLEWQWSRIHPLQTALQHLQITLSAEECLWLNQVWQSNRRPQEVQVQALTRSPAVREALKLWQSLLDAAARGSANTLLTRVPALLSAVPTSELKEIRELGRQELSVTRLVEMLTPKPETQTASVEVRTIHSAKGLEFPAVIVLTFPYHRRERSLTDEEYIEQSWKNPHWWKVGNSDEEEARIAYVALTRSTDRLSVITQEKSLYLDALSPGRRRQFRLFHDLMTCPPDAWTTQHLTAFPCLSDDAANAAYLERHWWKSAELATLRRASEVLVSAGRGVPATWREILSGTLHRAPMSVTVKRRSRNDLG